MAANNCKRYYICSCAMVVLINQTTVSVYKLHCIDVCIAFYIRRGYETFNYYILHRAYYQYKFDHVTAIRTLDPRGLLNLSSLHGPSTAFPVDTRHTSPLKDMENTVSNNTRRLVDTQSRIYQIEGAFLSVVAIVCVH